MNTEDIIKHCVNIIQGKLSKYGIVKVTYLEVIKQDPDLDEVISNDFENFNKCLQLAYEIEFKDEYESKNQPLPEVRLVNIPDSMVLGIGEIRKEHLDKFYSFEGTLIKAGDVWHAPASIKFECPSCLPKGTLVLTDKGYQPIEKAKIVISLDHRGKFIPIDTKIIKTGKKGVMSINNEIFCSENHQWFVYRNGNVQSIQTKDLNINDVLLRLNDKAMCNLWEEEFEIKQADLLRNLQEGKLFKVSNWWGKSKSRQQTNNKIVSKRLLNCPDWFYNWKRSQINQEKTSKRRSKTKNSKRTMYPECEERKYLQAWGKMWGKRISQIGKRKFKMGLSNLWGIEGQKQRIIGSPQGWQSLQQFSREFDGALSIMPYKITSISRETQEVEMYDLQVPLYNNFILSNGIISHNCGNILNVLQLSEKLLSPSRCGCGRKGQFREVGKKWKNVQFVIVEERITDYTKKKARPSIIKVRLEENLTDEDLTKKIEAGRTVKFNGIIKPKQIRDTIFFSNEILCNDFEIEDFSFYTLPIPKNYIKKFKELKEDPDLLKDLSNSLCYETEGMEIVKEILTVSRARGVKSYKQNGKLKHRDTINILLAGDPGTNKSEIAKQAIEVDPIQMAVSGKGVSGPGLASTTVLDKDLNCYCVLPGAVPRCNNGSILIDEGDKIEDKDLSTLNEAMTYCSFITAKAGQQVTLAANTNIIIAINPEGRKFDPYVEKWKQLPLKPDMLDRCDIWIGINKEESKQKKITEKIIEGFTDYDKREDKAKYSIEFLRYYFAWIIQTFKPIINSEMKIYARDEINKTMNKKNNSEDGGDISYRLVANIIRFSLALAKIKQCDEVSKENIDRAIFYQMFGFKSLQMVTEDGNLDPQKYNFETPIEEKRKKYTLIDIIIELHEANKKNPTTDEIEARWEEEGNDPKEVYDLLEKEKRRGNLFEPKGNQWRVI